MTIERILRAYRDASRDALGGSVHTLLPPHHWESNSPPRDNPSGNGTALKITSIQFTSRQSAASNRSP